MSFLVETTLPFHVTTDTAQVASFNHVAFSLLEYLGDGNRLQQNEANSDIQRLEHKVDLLLFLLSQFMQQQQKPPAAQTLRLNSDSISWQTSEQFEVGQLVSITLYVHHTIPVPLCCQLEIVEQDTHWVFGRLHNLAEEDMAAWSRWVFRQHRRTVAMNKQMPLEH